MPYSRRQAMITETEVRPAFIIGDMDNTAARIRHARTQAGLRQEDLAKRCGISRAGVAQWEAKDPKKRTVPTLENFKCIAVSTGCGLEWLQTGQGPQRPTAPADPNVEPGPDVGPYRAAPVVGTAQLGAEGYFQDLGYPVGHGEGYVDVPSRDPNAYALRVRGDSMAPAIRSGWLVVIEPNRPLVPGEYVLICLKDERCMIKELLFERGDEVSVMSVNEAYGRMTFHREQIEKLHYVGFIVPPSKLRL